MGKAIKGDKGFIHIVPVLVLMALIIGTVITVSMVQRVQDPRSHAATPPSQAGKQFVTLVPGSALPSDSVCASRVRRTTWEPRFSNQQANNTVPSGLSLPNWTSIDARANTQFKPRITGNFTGTTDEIIQWGACKWGFDEDIVRATAVNESWWRQATRGDWRDTQTEIDKCIAEGIPIETVSGKQGCYESLGLMQIKGTVHHGTYPLSKNSSAFNVDYALALKRICFEGWITWLEQRTPAYTAGDEWGCVGQHYSGGWHDEGAEWYIPRVKNHLNQRTWEQPSFAEAGTPTPMPTPGGSISNKLTIYADALSAGWTNQSWGGTAVFNQANNVYSGSTAIGFDATEAWAGLHMRNASGVSTSGYTHLQFAARAGSSGQNYYVIVKNAQGVDLKAAQSLTNYGGQPTGGAWQLYTIDLATLNATNTTIGGVIIQAGTAVPSGVFVDDVALVKFSTANPSPSSSATYTANAIAPLTAVPAGSTAAITATVTSSTASTVLVDVEIFNPQAEKVHVQGFDNESFTANQQRSFTVNWPVPMTAPLGQYTVKVGVFAPGWGTLLHWNNNAAQFSVSVAPSPSPTPLPSPRWQDIQITQSLTLDKTSVRVGETVTGNVTYKNAGPVPFTILQLVIAGRPPGGTNLGGPFLDFTPLASNIILQPGQSRGFTASRTISATDPIGRWYSFSTFAEANGTYHDATSVVNFDVLQVTPSPSPTAIPCAKTGDYDRDCDVDVTDLSSFLTKYSAKDPAADLNRDSIVTIADLSVFLSAFGK